MLLCFVCLFFEAVTVTLRARWHMPLESWSLTPLWQGWRAWRGGHGCRLQPVGLHTQLCVSLRGSKGQSSQVKSITEDWEGVSVWGWHVICCYGNAGYELCPLWTSAETRGDSETLPHKSIKPLNQSDTSRSDSSNGGSSDSLHWTKINEKKI